MLHVIPDDLVIIDHVAPSKQGDTAFGNVQLSVHLCVSQRGSLPVGESCVLNL